MKYIRNIIIILVIALCLTGCWKEKHKQEYNYDELATNKEVNIKISDVRYYEDYVSILIAFENISEDGIEYDPLDFVLQSSNGDNERYIYSSKDGSSLSANGQIMWELHFEYSSVDNLKLVYKKDFIDKTIVINLDYDEETGETSHNCSDESTPFDVALCESVSNNGTIAVVEDGLDDAEMSDLMNDIELISGIESITFVSREELLSILIRSSEEYAGGTLDMYNIKSAFIINLNADVEVKTVVNQIKKIKGIERVSYWYR